MVPDLEDVYQAWMEPGYLVSQYRREVYLHTRSIVDAQFSEHGARRIQAVTIDREIEKRFMDRMGFQVEGVMRSFFGLSIDGILFGRVA